MKKSIKTLFGALCLALCAVSFAPKSALAHGEKALEPFIRMRTIQWYDVAWSKSKLNVNEEVAITGKFHVSEDWPRGVAKPDATYLNVSAPGPVLIRTERYLNGQSTVSSAALRPGGDYDFKIVMKARMPGRFHLHPFFNLHDAGAVVGPGPMARGRWRRCGIHQSGENARRQRDRHGNLRAREWRGLACLLDRAGFCVASVVGQTTTVHPALQNAAFRPGGEPHIAAGSQRLEQPSSLAFR